MRAILYATLLAPLLAPALAHAAELNILTSGSTYPAEKKLGEDFTKKTGTTLAFQQGATGMMVAKLKSGAPADVIVLSAAAMDALDKEGALLKGSKALIGSSALGMGVAKDAARPDISTPEKFRAALLAAKAVLVGDPARGGTSSIPIDKVLKRPEFAGVKTKIVNKAPTAALAQGEGDVALELVGDILAEKDIQLVGAFPDAYNTNLPYAAAIPDKSTQAEAARAFIKMLTNRDASIIWHRTGIEATN